jgi:tetratricopeptide (TPR) repeat protein
VKDNPPLLRSLASRFAAAYHVMGDDQAVDEVVRRYPEAAAGIGDVYASAHDWDRAISEYSKYITDQTADGSVLAKRAMAYDATARPDLASADWQRAARQYADLAPDLAQAVFARARSRVVSGASAFESGRRDEAIRVLEQAREILQVVNQTVPEDDRVATQLAISVGFLGSAFRDEHRPAEALACVQEARRVLEAIRRPTPLDLYNLACTYANLSELDGSGTTPPSSTERKALGDRAMDALRRSIASGMTNFAIIVRDHDLDPLRDRADFRALILDRDFPSNPFANSALRDVWPATQSALNVTTHAAPWIRSSRLSAAERLRSRPGTGARTGRMYG